MLLKNVRTAIVTLALFTVITGFFYPMVVTGIAQLLFPGKANGSLLMKNGKAVGSQLIGQPFNDPKYFWGRLSVTTPYAYNAGASAGSNYGPLNPALYDAVRKRIQDLKDVDSLNSEPIPVDLVTASGSGLDPHISVAAAMYQLPRVARIRHLRPERVKSLVTENTEARQLAILGEPRVNVLKLNLALDAIQY